MVRSKKVKKTCHGSPVFLYRRHVVPRLYFLNHTWLSLKSLSLWAMVKKLVEAWIFGVVIFKSMTLTSSCSHWFFSLYINSYAQPLLLFDVWARNLTYSVGAPSGLLQWRLSTIPRWLWEARNLVAVLRYPLECVLARLPIFWPNEDSNSFWGLRCLYPSLLFWLVESDSLEHPEVPTEPFPWPDLRVGHITGTYFPLTNFTIWCMCLC